VGTGFNYTLVDGIWVTSKCSVESREDFASRGPILVSRMGWERTNINSHPDFAKAFNLGIPDGTLFFGGHQGAGSYVWKDGKVVPQADDANVGGIHAAIHSARSTQPSLEQ
jgi:hypothetical protein